MTCTQSSRHYEQFPTSRVIRLAKLARRNCHEAQVLARFEEHGLRQMEAVLD